MNDLPLGLRSADLAITPAKFDNEAFNAVGMDQLSRGLRSGFLTDDAGNAAYAMHRSRAAGDETKALALDAKRKEFERRAGLFAPAVQDWDHVHNVGDAVDWGLGAVGQGLGSSIKPAIGGLAGAALGTLVGHPHVGAFAGAYLPAVMMERNEAALQATHDPKIMATRSAADIVEHSNWKGAGNGILEAAVPSLLGGGLFKGAARGLTKEAAATLLAEAAARNGGKPLAAEAANALLSTEAKRLAGEQAAGLVRSPGSMLGHVAKTGLKDAAEEGATEAVQNITGQVTQNSLRRDDLDKIKWKDVAQDAVAGALAGKVMGATRGVSDVGHAGFQKVTGQLPAIQAMPEAAPEAPRTMMDRVTDVQADVGGLLGTGMAKVQGMAEDFLDKRDAKKAGLPYEDFLLAKAGIDPRGKTPEQFMAELSTHDTDRNTAGSQFAEATASDPGASLARQAAAAQFSADLGSGVPNAHEGLTTDLQSIRSKEGLIDKSLTAIDNWLSKAYGIEPQPKRRGSAMSTTDERGNNEAPDYRASVLAKVMAPSIAQNMSRDAFAQLDNMLNRFVTRDMGKQAEPIRKELDKLFGSSENTEKMLSMYREVSTQKGDVAAEMKSAASDWNSNVQEDSQRPIFHGFSSKDGQGTGFDTQHTRARDALTNKKAAIEGQGGRAQVVGAWAKLKSELGEHPEALREQENQLLGKYAGMTPEHIAQGEAIHGSDFEKERSKRLAEIDKRVKFLLEHQHDNSEAVDIKPADLKSLEATGGKDDVFGTSKHGRIFLERKAVAQSLNTETGEVVQGREATPWMTSAIQLVKHMREAKKRGGMDTEAVGDAHEQLNLLHAGISSLMNTGEFTGRVGVKDSPKGEIRWLSDKARKGMYKGESELHQDASAQQVHTIADLLPDDFQLHGVSVADANKQAAEARRAGEREDFTNSSRVKYAETLKEKREALTELANRKNDDAFVLSERQRKEIAETLKKGAPAINKLYTALRNRWEDSRDGPKKRASSGVLETEEMAANNAKKTENKERDFDEFGNPSMAKTDISGEVKAVKDQRTAEELARKAWPQASREQRAALKKAVDAKNVALMTELANEVLGKQNKQSTDTEASDLSAAELGHIRDEMTKTLGPDVSVEFASLIEGPNGEKWSGDWTENAIRIALNASSRMGTARHEAMHQLFSWLQQHGGKQTEALLKNLATNPLIMKQLKILLAEHPEALKQIAADPEEAAAFLYQFWRAGQVQLGTKAEGFFNKVAGVLARTYQKIAAYFGDEKALNSLSARHDLKLAEQVMAAFSMGEFAKGEQRSVVIEALEKLQTAEANRRENAAAMMGKLQQVMKKAVFTAGDAFENSKNPFVRALGERFFQFEGMKQKHQPYLERHAQVLAQKATVLRNILAKYDKEVVALAGQYLRDRRDTASIHHPEAKQAVQEVREYLQNMRSYLVSSGTSRWDGDKQAWVPMGEVKDNYFPRVWSTESIVKDSGKFLTMLEADIAEYRKNGGYAEIGKDFSAEAMAKAIMNRLINGHGAEEITESSSDLGITPYMAAVNKRELTWLDDARYAEFMDKDMVHALTNYTAQAVKRAEYVREFGNGGEQITDHLDKAIIYELGGQKLVDKAEQLLPTRLKEWKEQNKVANAKDVEAPVKPTLRSVALDELIGDKVVELNPDKRVMAPESDPTFMKNAEEARAKAKEAVEEKLLKALKKLEPVVRGVQAMEGTLGHDIDPKLRKSLSALTTYQNFRLLIPSLFGSITDPLGIVVRGGEMKDAWNAFVRGIREVGLMWKNEYSQDELAKLAEEIGTTEAGNYLDAMGQTYSSMFMFGKLKKWNDALFKWNGMEAWNRAMRIQATGSAISFIKRHLTKPNEHSARYMEELFGTEKPEGVLKEDGELDFSNDKVKEAVMRWVNGAILRPNAAQRPLLASDPHYMAFYHLKQFSYSFHKTLLRRAAIEAKEGNYAPAAILFTTFIPVSIAADLVKAALLPGTPAWTHSLGAAFNHGFERANLTGVPGMFLQDWNDPLRWFGPSVSEVEGFMKVPLFEDQHMTTELLGALPGGSILRKIGAQ